MPVGADHLVTEVDLQEPVGFVVYRRHHGLIAQRPGSRVLGQHLVAGDDRLDRPEAGQGVDRRAGREAREVEMANVCRLGLPEGPVLSRTRCRRLVGVALLLGPPLPPGVLVVPRILPRDRGQNPDDPRVELIHLAITELGGKHVRFGIALYLLDYRREVEDLALRITLTG